MPYQLDYQYPTLEMAQQAIPIVWGELSGTDKPPLDLFIRALYTGIGYAASKGVPSLPNAGQSANPNGRLKEILAPHFAPKPRSLGAIDWAQLAILFAQLLRERFGHTTFAATVRTIPQIAIPPAFPRIELDDEE